MGIYARSRNAYRMCTEIAHAPAASMALTKASVFSGVSSRRILQVTGIGRASRRALIMDAALSGSCRRAAPIPPCHMVRNHTYMIT